MKIIWLGHSGFRIEIADRVLLIDPWLENPLFDSARRSDAIAGVTDILVSHAHFDHASAAPALATELGVPVAGIFDLMGHWEAVHAIEVVGFNKGGTIALGDGVAVTMVNATHSSSFGGEVGPVYGGGEAGFMIAGEGHTIYFSGDTDVMADMELFEELHHPDIGILAAGGHFTMDMNRAAFAARRFFNFKTVIPCHYRTFPLLEQSAAALREALPGVDVLDPEVMETIEIGPARE